MAEHDVIDECMDDGSCWECGGAGGWHDCFDDTCCCLDPDEITEICESCHGSGYIADAQEPASHD